MVLYLLQRKGPTPKQQVVLITPRLKRAVWTTLHPTPPSQLKSGHPTPRREHAKQE